jgi:hypothetical protein
VVFVVDKVELEHGLRRVLPVPIAGVVSPVLFIICDSSTVAIDSVRKYCLFIGL